MAVMKVVLINGEKQIGKSTLARAIVAEYQEWSPSFVGGNAGVYSVVQPLELAINGMSPRWRDLSYEEFKRSNAVQDPGLAGITGRDILIQFGNAVRALHPYLLPAILYETVVYHQDRLVVVENWGLASELEYFQSLASVDKIDLITVGLVKRQVSSVGCGEPYPNDNRFRLDHMAEFVDPDFVTLMRAITDDNDYPFVDRIAKAFPPAKPADEADKT